MAAVALIILDQTGPASAGEALEGTLVGGATTVTNSDNTDVDSWTITLLDAPPDSATYPAPPVVLGSAVSNTPSASFTPDVAGSYRIGLEVVDVGAASDLDIREFGVRNARNIIIPPYQQVPAPLPLTGFGSKPDEQNYGGQTKGWAGDGSSGQLREFMTTYDDLPFTTVSTTPHVMTALDAPMVFVDTGAVGADTTVTLPAGSAMRVGQRIRVVARNTGAFTTTVDLPVAHTINGTLATWTLLPGMGAEFVYRGTSDYLVVGSSRHEIERSVVASLEVTDQTGFAAIGAAYLDPADYPNLIGVSWRAVIETTDGADAAEIRLYNITTSSVVASSTLSTAALIPTVVSSAITLATGPNLYEAQLRLQTTGSPNLATCKQAQLIFDKF